MSLIRQKITQRGLGCRKPGGFAVGIFTKSWASIVLRPSTSVTPQGSDSLVLAVATYVVGARGAVAGLWR